jgi:hypothetical protein
MFNPSASRRLILAVAFAVVPLRGAAQGTAADYERADNVAERTQGLVVDVPETPHWLSENRFWYRKSVRGGNMFVMVDAAAAQKRTAFDHDKIAAALGAATGRTYTSVTLPFTTITFVDGESAIDVVAEDALWRCSLAAAVCTRRGPAPEDAGRGRGGRNGEPLFGGPYYGGDGNRAGDGKPRVSPDGRTEAYIRDHNIWTRPAGGGPVAQLSFDGRWVMPMISSR